MRRILTPQRAVTAMTATFVLVAFGAALMTRPAAARAADVPPFLKVGECYRFTFSVEGMPAWKVLAVANTGWIKAEVDAGPASAQREPAWINTAQIVTARTTRCSD